MEDEIEIKPRKQKLDKPKFICKERFDPDTRRQKVTVIMEIFVL